MCCFNSLQTGKWIQSIRQRLPNNGRSNIPLGFNSLQTGKWIQRQSFNGAYRRFTSFNSLQTGKWIQSIEWMNEHSLDFEVSIPFKRESGFRVKVKKSLIDKTVVSIPFKRESGFREALKLVESEMNRVVSIPFKRESGFRGIIQMSVQDLYNSGFNSLQTGKWIQRLDKTVKASNADAKFQFPSNGKVDSEKFNPKVSRKLNLVSIPFKRESGFRAYLLCSKLSWKTVSIPFKRESGFRALTTPQRWRREKCFNSLQTGKCIQR